MMALPWLALGRCVTGTDIRNRVADVDEAVQLHTCFEEPPSSIMLVSFSPSSRT